jgi:glycosyltransferase involved in cell wall biosynthesis
VKYYLIGPYPPPLGGISVFIDRYGRLLSSQGEQVVYVDLSKLNRAQKLVSLLDLAFNPKDAIFHVNGFEYYSMLALVLRPFRGRVIFQDHSGRLVTDLSQRKRILVRRFLKRVDEGVFVGEHLPEYYRRDGYSLPSSIQIRNAFLPPPLEDEPSIWETYASETRQFVREHSPLIVANAFKIVFHQGVDLYGLDMCVDLVAELVGDYPNVGLLFALAEVGDHDYYQEINRRIDTFGIRKGFCFMTGQKELWPLFRKADLMVRPTFVDGYGISVEEALYLGCPAVASDVCARAKGTVLFRNRDSADFSCQVRRSLGGPSE